MLSIRTMLLAGLVVVLWQIPANAQRGIGPGEMIDLQDQLETGLQARRQVEFDYIQQVVDAVARNELPRSMVQSSFQYARKRRPYPFQYFQRVLRIQASRAGLRAP